MLNIFTTRFYEYFSRNICIGIHLRKIRGWTVFYTMYTIKCLTFSQQDFMNTFQSVGRHLGENSALSFLFYQYHVPELVFSVGEKRHPPTPLHLGVCTIRQLTEIFFIRLEFSQFADFRFARLTPTSFSSFFMSSLLDGFKS